MGPLQNSSTALAPRLRVLRELSLYKDAWSLAPRTWPEETDARFQLLRLCRDTDRIEDAEPWFGKAPDAAPELIGEQLSVLCHFGDIAKIGIGVDEALPQLESEPGAAFGFGECYLVTSTARAQAVLGGGTAALRTMRLIDERAHPEVKAQAPEFVAKVFLLQRQGWVGEARRLILERDDLHAEDDDDDDRFRRMRRLVASGRALTNMGDAKLGLKHLREARLVSDELAATTGVTYPWPWRWLITSLRIGGHLEEARELLDDTADEIPLWIGDDSTVPGLTLARSPIMRLERVLWDLWAFDGREPERLDTLLEEIDAVAATFGVSAELVWTKAQLLRRLNRPEELRALVERHPNNAFPGLELAKLLNEHSRHREAGAVVDGVLRRQPAHREALLQAVHIEANLHSPAKTNRTGVIAAARRLVRRIPEDAAMVGLAAEKLAQNGHFRVADQLFSHLTVGNPSYGLAWAGRIRAAAWNHDWPLVSRIETEFAGAEVPLADQSIGAPERIPALRFTIARALARAGRMDYWEASDLLEEASEIFTSGKDSTATELEEVQVVVWQVESLRLRDRPRLARELCEASLHRFGRNSELLAKYGWVLLDCQEPELAFELFETALRYRAGEGGAWRGLIHALVNQLRYDEAFEHAERARLVMRNAPSILCETAWIHHLTHRLDLAVAALDEALDVAPNHPTALAWRAIYLADLRDYAGAVDAGERACELRPENLEVWQAHCFALLRAGDHKRAFAVIQRARRQFGIDVTDPFGGSRPDDDVEIELVAAGVFAQCGADLRTCQPVIAHLLEQPHIPEAVRTASSLYRHQLDFPLARGIIERTPGWEDIPELLHEHAEVAAAQGEFDVAERDLARAIHLSPHSIMLYSRQCQLWNAQHRFADSISLLDRIQQRMPGHFAIEFLRAETYLESGQADRALKVCAELGRRYDRADYRAIRLRIVEIRARRASGDIHGALRLAEDLRKIVPMSRRARLALARSLEDVDRTANSIALLERALRELPLYPPCAENMALFCRFQGDHVRAHRVLAGAMSHYEFAPDRKQDIYRRVDAGLLAELVLTFTEQRDFAQARHFLRVLLDRPDVHSRSLGHICQGWYCLKRGAPEWAALAFQKAIDTGICLSEARFGLTFARMKLADRERDPEVRRGHWLTALRLAETHHVGSDFERTMILAGNAAFELGDWARAELHFRKSVEMHPVHGSYVGLAITLSQQGRLDESLRVIEQADRSGQFSARLLAVRGLVRLRLALERGGTRLSLEKAARDINRALVLDSKDPTVLSAIVYAANHTDLYEPAEALNLLRRARKAESNRDSVTVMANLRLMTAEVLLRRNPVKRLRRGAVYWARRSSETSWHPRAWAIITSRRHRRTARASARYRTAAGLNPEPPNGQDKSARERRVTSRILLTVGTLCLVAPLLFGMLGSPGGRLYLTALMFPGIVLLGAGAFFPRLSMFRWGGLELRADEGPLFDEPVHLPTALPPQAPVMPQAIAAEFHTHWLPQPRFMLLGPAVGQMLNGHYAYRDAYFPWRTR